MTSPSFSANFYKDPLVAVDNDNRNNEIFLNRDYPTNLKNNIQYPIEQENNARGNNKNDVQNKYSGGKPVNISLSKNTQYLIIEQLKKEIEQLTHEKQITNEQHATQEENYRRQLASIQNQSQNQYEQLNHLLTSERNTTNLLRVHNRELNEKLSAQKDALKNQEKEFYSQLSLTNKEKEELKDRFKNTLREHKAYCDNIEQADKTKESQLNKNKQQLEQYQSNLGKKENQLYSYQMTFAQQAKELTQLKQQQGQAQEKINHLNNQLNKATSTRRNADFNPHEELIKKLADKDREIQQLKEQVNNLTLLLHQKNTPTTIANNQFSFFEKPTLNQKADGYEQLRLSIIERYLEDIGWVWDNTDEKYIEKPETKANSYIFSTQITPELEDLLKQTGTLLHTKKEEPEITNTLKKLTTLFNKKLSTLLQDDQFAFDKQEKHQIISDYNALSMCNSRLEENNRLSLVY